MSSRFRSSSLGAVPHPKTLARSRAESSAPTSYDVRCACQFFQSDSLIPERINPVGTRPHSKVENEIINRHTAILERTVEEETPVLSFGKSSVPDYYANTNSFLEPHEPLTHVNQSIPSIEVETFRDYPIFNENTTKFSSQKSLDRYSTSAMLLNKYRDSSRSKTVSFDGQPSHKNKSNENHNFDQYHCMSPMVFNIRDQLPRIG